MIFIINDFAGDIINFLDYGAVSAFAQTCTMCGHYCLVCISFGMYEIEALVSMSLRFGNLLKPIIVLKECLATIITIFNYVPVPVNKFLGIWVGWVIFDDQYWNFGGVLNSDI